MATPEARELANQFPGLLDGHSTDLCEQAAVNFIEALAIRINSGTIYDLAQKHGVGLPLEIRNPYRLITQKVILCDQYISIPGSLSLEKRSSGLPARLVVGGPYAGLICFINLNGDSQVSHFWNEDRWASAPRWASCPVNKHGVVVYTSEPHNTDFHYAYSMLTEEWYYDLTNKYRTTSEALFGLMRQAGIPPPRIFNKVIQDNMYTTLT